MTQLIAQAALVTGANRGLGREFVHPLWMVLGGSYSVSKAFLPQAV